MVEEQPGDGGDQAGLVGARQGEKVGFGHRDLA
jgi:hypothetical protein